MPNVFGGVDGAVGMLMPHQGQSDMEPSMNPGKLRTVIPAAAGRPLVTLLAAGALVLGSAVSGFAASGSAAPVPAKDQPPGPFLLAQAPPPTGAAGASATAPRRPRNPDQTFAEEAAEGGMAEIEAGKLAQSHAAATSVKAFAQQMVADHGKANDQLKQLAVRKGITLPTSLPRRRVRDIENAGKLKGADFDRAYIKMMVNGHKKTIALFEREAKHGKDPELKSYAATLLPDLHKHLQMAESTEAESRKSGNR